MLSAFASACWLSEVNRAGEVNRKISINVNENITFKENRENEPSGFCCSFEFEDYFFSCPLSCSKNKVIFQIPCVSHAQIQMSNVWTQQQGQHVFPT